MGLNPSLCIWFILENASKLACFVYLCHHHRSHLTKLLTRALFFGPCHCSYVFVPCLDYRVHFAGDLNKTISFVVGALSSYFVRALLGLRGARRNFLRRGLKFWEKYFALTKVQATLFTITFMSYSICYFNFNTSTLFLTRSSRDVSFSLPVFPRYRGFVNLLKYDAM